MKKIKALFVLLIIVLCVFSIIIGSRSSEAVQIKGKSLGSISDIVKTATDSEFPEMQKHSLLLYERFSNGSGMTRYQPRIFTIRADGSLRKQYEIEGNDSYFTAINPRENTVQKMNLSISEKRFGTRRNILFSIAGSMIDGKQDSAYRIKTLESTGTEDSAVIKSANTEGYYGNIMYDNANRNIWESAHLTVKGFEDKDVFVYLHSSVMAQSGSIHFRFRTANRNETGSVTWNDLHVQDEDSDGWKIFDYNHGIRGAGIAAGDFDGDGYKNEIFLAWNNNDGVYAYIYKVDSAGGNRVKVTRTMPENLVHGGVQTWGIDYTQQSSLAALAGDFDGDGVDEAAIVTRTNGLSTRDIRVKVFKFNRNSNNWTSDELSVGNDFLGTLKATKADLNGDGQDEIVILFNQVVNGTIYPRLEFWSFNKGSIKPVRNAKYNKGGANDRSLLGYSIEGNVYNQYYKTAEDFSMTAGPLTGTMGKIKLADDIAISHVNSDASRVFVIPTKLDGNKNFSGFGDTTTVYNANEALMLDKPSHTFDDHDTSYTVVLQAMPYHVDNVDINGNLTQNPINYTFSGFEGDEGNGKMKVAYTKASSISNTKDVSFNMASTTETISLLGDAGSFVHGYLKFQTMQANIAGNFDERAKTAASAMNSIMDFVTDRIDQTTTNSTAESNQTTVAETMNALVWDRLLSYSARQHIWRYKILNNPLPSWYKLGLKADNSTKEPDAESKEHYITFTIYDTVTPNKTPSDRNNTYQARHEEGNLFSYPSELEDIEGYNSNGELAANPAWIAWTKGGESSTSIRFEKSKIESQKYEEEVHKSELRCR